MISLSLQGYARRLHRAITPILVAPIMLTAFTGALHPMDQLEQPMQVVQFVQSVPISQAVLFSATGWLIQTVWRKGWFGKPEGFAVKRLGAEQHCEQEGF